MTVLLAQRWFGAAQKKKQGPAGGLRPLGEGDVVHPAIVYATADDNAGHVAQVDPGHEVVVIERNGAWVRVFANTDTPDKEDGADAPEFGAEDAPAPESGWIKDKGIVTAATPNGDAILFGMGANLEDEAAQPHAPKDAAGASASVLQASRRVLPRLAAGGAGDVSRGGCALAAGQGGHQHAALGEGAGGLSAAADL
jgi:hypothetical protein